MNPIAGLSTTGRRLHGPASDLVELVNESGYRHTAIVFHPEYRDHPAINTALAVVAGYLESPMVTGMVELFSHDSSEGAFIYPTGQATSVAELNRTFADFGEAPGVRAGLELMYAAGEILIEASESGEPHGVYSHGGLTPWRLMIKPDGQAQIIGYALPQVEILRFHQDPQSIPREDSFRYCPPERMEAGAEDLSSDLFALALISFELMTGKPVYDGLVNDIRAMASRAEGSRRLFRFRDQLPRSVQDFLKVCLRRDTGDRYTDGDAFMYALQSALGGSDITGPSLIDVMARAGNVPQRVGTPLQDGGATMMVTREKLAEMVEEQDERPTRAAWKPPTRKRRASPRASASADEPAPQPTPAPEPEPAPDPQDVLRGSSDGPKWRQPSRRTPPSQEPTGSGDRQPDPPAAPQEPSESGARRASSLVSNIIGQGGRTPPARRRVPPRRMGSVDEAAPPVGPAPAPSPPVEPPPPPAAEPGKAPVRLPVRQRAAPSAPPEDTAPPVSLGPPPAVPAATPSTPPGDVPPRPRPEPTSSQPPPPPPVPVASHASPSLPPAPPRAEAPPPTPAPEPAPAATRPRVAPPAEPEPQPSAAPKAAPVSEAAPVSKVAPPAELTPAPAPTPVPPAEPKAAPAPAPVDAAVASPAARAPSTPASSGPVGVEGRVPDPLPADPAKGEAKRYSLRMGPGTKERRFRLPVDQLVSEAVAKLVGMLLPLRMDGSGRVVGWYRFSQDGVRPAGNPCMETFQAGTPIDLVLVPNRLVPLLISVEGEAGPVALRMQLGLAVPAVSLVDHLAELLSLPAGRWRLFADGRAMAPHEILEDLSDLDAVELVIRR